MIKKACNIIFLFVLIFVSNGANTIDSLKLCINASKTNNEKIVLLNELSKQYRYIKPDSSLICANEALKIAKENKNKSGIATSLYNTGVIKWMQGNYKNAMNDYQQCLELYIEINDKLGIAKTLNNIGVLLWNMGNYSEAIEYYHRVLKIYQDVADLKGESQTLNNIGIIYADQKNISNAITYFYKALDIKKKLNDKSGIATTLNNIGVIYRNQKKYADAIRYYNEALNIEKETANKPGIAISYNNIGEIYMMQKQYRQAINMYFNALKILAEVGDKREMANSLNSIGAVYLELGEYEKAADYFTKALTIAKELDAKQIISKSYEMLSDLYRKAGNWEAAYKYHYLYKQTDDSLFNQEKYKLIAEMDAKYKYETQQQQIELQKSQLDTKDLEVKQKKFQRNSFIFGFILMLILAIAIYSNYTQKNKANLLLTQQKEKIEHQNKEITDSIRYAGSIQNAVLTPAEILKKLLPEHFILFRPRDIVSGDFYWVTEQQNHIIIAAADCTGHGVPGAFMSILGITFLNEIVTKNNIIIASEILNHLRDNIIKSLHQTGQQNESKDGLDIALFVINKKTNTLQFAGANNPLYIIRNQAIMNASLVVQKDNYFLSQFNPDKMPIGVHPLPELPSFTNNIIPIQKDDILYIFSDGFADQFGGKKGKKLKYHAFRDLLLTHCNKPMSYQQKALNTAFDLWKGTHPQADDVLLIGIKIT